MSKKLYIAAAEYLFTLHKKNPQGSLHTGMCDAIQIVSERKNGTRNMNVYNDLQRALYDWMHPQNGDIDTEPYHSYWGKLWGRPLKFKRTPRNEWEYDEQEAYECRILALCFMAAIAEAGDL